GSRPMSTAESEKSHSFISAAEEFFHHLMEEASEAGHSIVEAAHKVWDQATHQPPATTPAGQGEHHDAKPADAKPQQAPQNAPAVENKPDPGAISAAQKHLEKAKSQAGQTEQKAPQKDGPKPNSQGLHKTKGPEDIVATFGTVPEASKHMGS